MASSSFLDFTDSTYIDVLLGIEVSHSQSIPRRFFSVFKVIFKTIITVSVLSIGADPGLFLGGGAPLRNGVTNTNKPHFFAEYQLH